MFMMFSRVVCAVEPNDVQPDRLMPGTQSFASVPLSQKWIDFEPRFRKTICPFHGQEDYESDIISCGDVLVPEDRTDPNSRLIKLAVMVVSVSYEDPPADAVVRLEGGLGAQSVTAFRASFYSGEQGLVPGGCRMGVFRSARDGLL